METNNAGGGEILQYVGNNNNHEPTFIKMDINVMRQFELITWVKLGIVILLILIVVLIILRMLHVKVGKSTAITKEFRHLDAVKQRDKAILHANKLINNITRIIERTALKLPKSYNEYWEYNLERADIRIPGGYRVMKPTELNAIIKTFQIVLVAIFLIVAILVSAPIGAMMILLTVIVGSNMPMATIRQRVKNKDNEIIENFSDMYLMIHYVLIAGVGTPIAGILKSFDKTTSSSEMHKFVNVCIHYIDTYGEYEATKFIAKRYREIPQVGKLMRLIRQANEGGDIRAELIGFRNELITAKKYAIELRMNKLIAKARFSFNLLVPILVQAIISAMAVYFEDLSLAGTFF